MHSRNRRPNYDEGAMSRWFRFYGEALNDHKVQSLTPDLFKTWVNLLCAASLNDGVLPPADRLSFELRVSAHEMQSRLDELVLLGLLDIRPDKKLEPHNWEKRQWKSDDSKERVRKHRNSKRGGNGDVTVTVTPPESESYTDTDTEVVSSLAIKPPQKRRKQGLNLICDVMKEDEEPEVVKRNAAGLGLNVEKLVDITNKRAKNNRSAYFTKLCVTELLERYPNESEEFLRDAIWGKGRALNDLFSRIMGAQQ